MADEHQLEEAWAEVLPVSIEGIAAAPTGVVAGGDSQGFLYTPAGDCVRTLDLADPLVDLCCPADGSVFAVLTASGVQGWTPEGELLWEVEIDKEASAIDLGRTARGLAFIEPPSTVHVMDVRTGDLQYAVKCGFEAASLALMEGSPSGILVASRMGHIGQYAFDGTSRWQYDLDCHTGEVQFNSSAELVVLAAHEEGLHTFRPDGEGAGAFDLGEAVTHATAVETQEGVLLALASGRTDLALMDMEGFILWEHSFDSSVGFLASSEDGNLISVAETSQRLTAFAASGAEPGEDVPSSEAGAEVSEATTVGEGVPDGEKKGGQKEEVMALGAPRPERAEVVAKTELPGGGVPDRLDGIHVTYTGDFVAVIAPAGSLLCYDGRGNLRHSENVDLPASIKKKRAQRLVAAWAPTEILEMDMEEGESRRLSIDSAPARLMDCSANLDLLTVVDEDDCVTFMQRDGQRICRKEIQPPPTHLHVSPSKGRVLTRDAEGRFRFFDARGNMLRKQRLAADEQFDQVILEDGFCAFGGSEGRVVVQDVSGKVLWAERVADSIARMESLENSFAVHDQGGTAMLINPYGEVTAELQPPPGLCMMRRPQGRDPVLLHARRNILTAYGGYRRKLEALWSFRCEDQIEVFEADRNARLVVVAAGNFLYFLTPPEE